MESLFTMPAIDAATLIVAGVGVLIMGIAIGVLVAYLLRDKMNTGRHIREAVVVVIVYSILIASAIALGACFGYGHLAKDYSPAIPPTATGFAALFTCFFAARVTKHGKQIEFSQQFRERYDQLTNVEVHLVNVNQATTAGVVVSELAFRYYRRFWNLQLQQWDADRRNYMPTGLVSNWLKLRARDFRDNSSVGGISFADGWAQARISLGNEDAEFRAVIDNLRDENPPGGASVAAPALQSPLLNPSLPTAGTGTVSPPSPLSNP